MRTKEQKLATKLRKAAERRAHRERVFKKHPPQIRYAKAKFKKGLSANAKTVKNYNWASNNNLWAVGSRPFRNSANIQSDSRRREWSLN